MCPLCITTAALSVAGATSGAGLVAVVAHKWRVLRRWRQVMNVRQKLKTRQGMPGVQ